MRKSVRLNRNFEKLDKNYLFSEINRRVTEYKNQHPSAEIISLGIGDVTQPLVPCAVGAIRKAAAEMGRAETFRGYPPETGYPFLKDAVIKYYKQLGVTLDAGEIFVSDGAKSDLGGLTDIFGRNTVLITNPVYPAYLDGNIIAGRQVEFLPATEENNFLPMPHSLFSGALLCAPKGRPCVSCVKHTKAACNRFVIYLCSPNNPTGSVYNRQQLTEWVEFAKATGSVIIFDAAYSAWVPQSAVSVNFEQKPQDRTCGRQGKSSCCKTQERRFPLPRSIFEIAGAESVAVEVNSLSKSCGFTNLRCSWTVIKNKELNRLWKRRQSAKFNGVPYMIQRAAEAVLSPAGQRQCGKQIAYYKENAMRLTEFLKSTGAVFYGGESSPYIWMKCPNGMGSWDFFNKLLDECQIVVTPGAGFGSNGSGFVRLSSFAAAENIAKAIERLKTAQIMI